MELAAEIYTLTSNRKFAKDFGLKNQIQRAGVSVASNIAESDERGTTKESIRYFK